MAITALPKQTQAGTDIGLGKDFLIDINTGESEANPTWTVIGGQRNGKLNRQAEEIDASHKTSGSWKDNFPGQRSWGIEGDAVVILDDAGVEALDYAFHNGLAVHVRFRFPNGENYIGWASIVDFSIDTAHTDVATLSLKLNGKGPLQKGTKITLSS